MPLIGRTQKSIPKLNAIDPFAYLTGSLTAIVSGPKHSRITELLSWTNQNDAIA
ncbi:transposase domain-containing protein [Rhizobium sp. WSM1325]|nr:transposase domain-containing protein [Rhizobium leguminosarum]